MAKIVKLTANERLDLDDLQDIAKSGVNSLKTFIEKVGINNWSRVIEGFRVVIPASGSSITVYNGVSFDRTGQLVSNEDDFSSSVSHNLVGNNTHYVEAEFVWNAATVEERALWDATYDNGTDVSGDALPPGREFKYPISTQYSPEWTVTSNIVGFTNDTTPDTIRIPIARINVVGGNVDTTGLTLYTATTLTKEDATNTNKLKVFNLREFPDTVPFDITVYQPESASSIAKTVNAIDKENGILTLSAAFGGTFASYPAGSRVVRTTGNSFLDERKTPTLAAGTTTRDARPRMLQADDDLGYALSRDPYSATGRSDLAVDNEKHWKDFMASQIREMKYGGLKASKVGVTAPPSTFSATPRYYEQSASILGAKTNTVSIGDGVNSWGDFNVAQYVAAGLTTRDCFSDAMSATGNGTLYIKKGTYSVTGASITVSGRKCIIGDGVNNTIIKTIGANPVFSGTPTYVYLSNLTIAIDETVSTASTSCSLKNATVVKCWLSNTEFKENSYFYDCIVTGTDNFTTTAPNSIVVSSTGSLAFYNCILYAYGPTASRCVSVNASSTNINFENCFFTTIGSPTYLVDITNTVDGLSFRNCVFHEANLNEISAINSTASITGLVVDSCAFYTNKGAVNIPAASLANSYLFNSSFFCEPVGGGIDSTPIVIGSGSNITVSSCLFKNTLSDTTAITTAITVNSTFYYSSIIDNKFECSDAIYVAGNTNAVTISNNVFGYFADGYSAIYMSGNNTDLLIKENIINGLLEVGKTLRGIHLSGNQTRVKISENSLYNIVSAGSISHAITIGAAGKVHSYLDILNNTISTVDGTGTSSAIYVSDSITSGRISVRGNKIFTIGASAATNAYGIYVVGQHNTQLDENTIESVGNAARPQTAYGIYFSGTDGASFVGHGSISGNRIRNILSDSLTASYGIYLANSFPRSIVSHNVVQPLHKVDYGIYINKVDANGSFLGLKVVNNVITPDTSDFCNTGIYLNGMTATRYDQEISIIGNTVDKFDVYGICVIGDNVSIPSGILVDSNFIKMEHNPTASAAGINIYKFTTVQVNSNHIRLFKDTGKQCTGIFVNAGDVLVCNNNTVALNNPDAAYYCINAGGVTKGNFVGNFLDRGNSAAGSCLATGLNSFAVGNIFVLQGTSPVAGPSPATQVLQTSGANPSLPSAVTDIMNLVRQ